MFKRLKEWFQYVNEWENLPEVTPGKRRPAGSQGFIAWLFGPESLGEAQDDQRRSRDKGFLRWLLEFEHLDAPSMSQDSKTR